MSSNELLLSDVANIILMADTEREVTEMLKNEIDKRKKEMEKLEVEAKKIREDGFERRKFYDKTFLKDVLKNQGEVSMKSMSSSERRIIVYGLEESKKQALCRLNLLREVKKQVGNNGSIDLSLVPLLLREYIEYSYILSDVKLFDKNLNKEIFILEGLIKKLDGEISCIAHYHEISPVNRKHIQEDIIEHIHILN
ncbi:MAG: hypothetical protein RSC24_06225 [Clostridium sp.]